MTDQPAAGDDNEPAESLETTVTAEADANADPATDGSRPNLNEDSRGTTEAAHETTTAPDATANGASESEPTSPPSPLSTDSDSTQATPSLASSDESSAPVPATGEPNSAATSMASATESGAPALETEDNETTTAPFDECPDHEAQLVAGNCGCGHEPDPRCDVLRQALSHRYSFVSHAPEEDYDGSKILDTVGGAHGSIHDADFDWDGSLLMDGQDGYVELPAGLLSAHDTVTVDLWVKWWGGDDNQRLLNFGLAPSDSDDAPDNYLSISPSGSNGVLTVQYRTNGDERGDRLETEGSLGTSDLQHVTVVIGDQSLTLFVDGASKATVETTHRLSDLDDDDNWLGRALYSGYPLYNGALFEFRVFGRALTDDEVEMLDQVGLDFP